MNNFQQYFDEQMAWANSTFPTADKHSIMTHLRRELDELEKDDNDPMEFADCMMLLLHFANKMGLTANDVITSCETKLAICRQRKWKAPDEHGVCHHVK